MLVQNYDPTKVVLLVGGIPVSGYADGSMIKCARNQDSMKLTKGADGQGVRSKSPDRSGKVTVSLLQSSASNGVFSALALLDQASSTGVVPVLLKDNNGKVVWTATEAWVMKPTEASWEKEVKDREWVLECDDLQFAEGGY
jgi:hypothetical protein